MHWTNIFILHCFSRWIIHGLGNKGWKQKYFQLLSLLMNFQKIYDRNFHAFEYCKITSHGPKKRHTLVRGNAKSHLFIPSSLTFWDFLIQEIASKKESHCIIDIWPWLYNRTWEVNKCWEEYGKWMNLWYSLA